MTTTAMTGSDSLIIDDHVFSDFADADCIALTFPNDNAAVKTGKNGNALFALNETGRQGDMKIRVIRGSADDKFLLGLYTQMLANFAAFALMQGEFIKQLGNGQGNISADTYIISGGIFQKEPEAKSNVEGDTSQSVTEWMLKFAKVTRVIT
jgi:hypothetical protein